MKSRNNLETLYLHYYNVYGYQSFQGSELPRRTPHWGTLVSSGDKSDALYLHLHRNHGNQTKQDPHLPQESPTIKAK